MSDDSNPSFYEQLKQRSVFRVGAMYLVASWLLLQIGDDVFVDYAIIVTLVIALAVMFLQRPQESMTTEEVLAKLSIAVLPFVNMSADPENEYFSDGVAEEILNVLAKLDGLDVASRTSAFAFKAENRNIVEIANILEVQYVLEGSVRKLDNRLRITAQLINADGGMHLWSETFDRELTDVFAIQDEIANAIVTNLRRELGDVLPAEITVEAGTENLDAYELYLKANSLLSVVSGENMRERQTLLERAVEIDPNFAEAWSALSSVLSIMPTWDYGLDQHEYGKRAITAANKALSLNPELMETYLVLSRVADSRFNWEDGGRFHVRAVETTWVSGARELGLGYLTTAAAQSADAIKTDDTNSFAHLINGMAHFGLNDTEKALASLEQAAVLGYRGPVAGLIAYYYFEQGQHLVYNTLVAEMMNGQPELFPLLPSLLELNRSSEQERGRLIAGFWVLAKELGFTRNQLLQELAPAFLMMLEENEAIADYFWGNAPLFWMWTPRLSDFRASEPFKNRVRSSGMLDYWRKRGWPDLCRPIGKDDFACN